MTPEDHYDDEIARVGLDYGKAFSTVCAIVLALCIFFLPEAKPLRLVTVLHHEVGHALAANITGGVVTNISIASNESGGCETKGGVTVVILMAGYFATGLFGSLLIFGSRRRTTGVKIVILLGVITTFSAISYPLGDLAKTYSIYVLFGWIVLGAISYYTWWWLASFIFRTLGVFWCIFTLFDVYLDSTGDNKISDAHALSSEWGEIFAPSAICMLWLTIVSAMFLLATNLSTKIQPQTMVTKTQLETKIRNS